MAKEAYHAYGKVTQFKNFQGNPMPEWDALTPTIRQAWVAAATKAAALAALDERAGATFDAREKSQIFHALNYAQEYADAGVPGHSQFILIAKLSAALGFNG